MNHHSDEISDDEKINNEDAYNKYDGKIKIVFIDDNINRMNVVLLLLIITTIITNLI